MGVTPPQLGKIPYFFFVFFLNLHLGDRGVFALFAFLLLFTCQQHKLHLVLEAAVQLQFNRLLMTPYALVLPQSEALNQLA